MREIFAAAAEDLRFWNGDHARPELKPAVDGEGSSATQRTSPTTFRKTKSRRPTIPRARKNEAPAPPAACSTGWARQPTRRSARRALRRERHRGAIDHPPAV